MALTTAIRHMEASPKVANRLFHEAIKEIARRQHKSMLEVEETYNNTRGSLAHLLVHERYPTSDVLLKQKLDALMNMTREMLARPDVYTVSKDPQWVERLRHITDDLEREYKSELDTALSTITREHVQTFLQVINALRSAYLRNGYDPAPVVDPPLYVLGQMVVANFDAHSATLNS